MVRRKKGTDSGDMHEQRRYEREARTKKLREIYRDVERILIRLRFQDDRQPNPEPRELVFAPESTAFFELKCPFYECVMGGFDFSAAVADTIRTRQARSEGCNKCRGWQDRERIDQHRCLLKAHYEVQVEYQHPVSK